MPERERGEVRVVREEGRSADGQGGVRWLIYTPGSDVPFSTASQVAVVEETLQGLLDLGISVEYQPPPTQPSSNA